MGDLFPNSIDNIFPPSNAGTFLNNFNSPRASFLRGRCSLFEDLPNLSCKSGTSDGENKVQSPFSITRFMNKSESSWTYSYHAYDGDHHRCFTQFQEFFDVHVPSLEVSADRAFTLTTLIDRHRRVIHDLEERHNTLRLTVRTLDMAPKERTGVQSLPKPPAYFASNAFSLIASQIPSGRRSRRQIAGGQLRTLRTTIKELVSSSYEIESR